MLASALHSSLANGSQRSNLCQSVPIPAGSRRACRGAGGGAWFERVAVMKHTFFRWVISGVLASGALSGVRPAAACGGFFCSQSQPVNQAAERIIFAKNNDGTVTAVIEIQYQGPAKNFSWLLPISSVPKDNQIAVASNVAFQRLQAATNPQYNLTTRVEGQCDEDRSFSPNSGVLSGSAGTGGASAGPQPSATGVTVEAAGIVGAFQWTVISLEASLPNPADSAVKWLREQGYDVPPGAPGLLGPYLADGMYLLALRLVKGADAGSIRPLVLTYQATKPMIPIKLTAVAANENMGVLTWVLGESQAIPQNYYGLELNEARINWFNAASNYNDVVTAAANDAGGQGFVTEYAQPSANLKDVVWSAGEESSWQDFRKQSFIAPNDLFLAARDRFGFMDGFWDVVAKYATSPSGAPTDWLRNCYPCQASLDPAQFLAGIDADVIQPVRLVQQLIDAHPQVTRLYTTLSAAEMTVDPLFAFNADLAPVNNIHTAERIIECAPGFYQNEAPWRIELPKGGVVRGGPAQIGTWPDFISTGPANRRILRQAESGSGKMLEDNTSQIVAAVASYSAALPKPEPRAPVSGGTGGTGGTASMSGGGQPVAAGATTSSGSTGVEDNDSVPSNGCSASGTRGAGGFGLSLFLGLALALRWRRTASEKL